MINTMVVGETTTDTELVARSLEGDTAAFGQIVSRYQSLVCSLAYSATGSLGESQDLAQETFITAWRHLRLLRERQKLRAWLCGIARCLIGKTLRRDRREPIHAAEPLDAAQDSAAVEPLPSERVITREEEAILWRSIERIPELYREPMVLFYRQHQSVENVAAALDLSEDTVKQRLSRGRKLLADEVATFVETALGQTNPGRAFTIGVVAALPVVLSTSAKAATIGAVAAKGGAAAKAAVGAGFFNAIIGPVLGFVGPWLQYRVFLAAAQTDQERASIKSYYHRLLGLVLGFAGLLVAFIFFGKSIVQTHPLWFAGALIGLVLAYVCAAIRMGVWANMMFRKLREQRGELTMANPAKLIWEYRSPFALLGLPLVHFRFNNSPAGRSPVKAWIAAGDFAIGGLFAFGGLAIAPFSIGGVAIGLMSWGGAVLGGLTMGGFALGGWAFGGFALGWQSFGGCAVAWNAAMGGLAIARDFALGGVAQAAQANNEIATQFIKGAPFFQRMEMLSRHIGWLNLLWLLPLSGWWRIMNTRAAKNLGIAK